MVPWRIAVGLGLVALGVLFLLDLAGLVNAGQILARWWPLAIVVLGVLELVSNRETPAGPAFVIVIGLGILGLTLGVLPGATIAVFWAVVLIATGVWLLLSRLDRSAKGISAQDIVDSFAVLGDIKTQSASQSFRGGFLGGLLGEVTLDLREARLAPEGASISSMAVLSDVTVRVPEGWRVQVGGVPILADIENSTAKDGQLGSDTPVLKLQAVALLTDIKITH